VLRLAIIGAGVMGSNHARVAMSLRDAEVVAVHDPDQDRASVLADAVGAKAVPSVEAAIESADAVVVAAPNHLHAPIALQCLAARVPVLVEKPLAPTLEEADALIEAAARSNTILLVGHIERFNPAVLELDRLANDIVHVDAARVSPYSPRIRDDVVLDLMIHDIDIVLALAGSQPVEVHAVGQSVRSSEADIVSALIRFENDVTASITASRVGQTKIRQLQITQRENFVSVDLIRQDVTISRVDHAEFLSAAGTRYRQSGVVEIPFLEHQGEPLHLELAHFVNCVLGTEEPRVPATVGRQALALAFRIRDAAMPPAPPG
jgi:predicted dehydrogenase